MPLDLPSLRKQLSIAKGRGHQLAALMLQFLDQETSYAAPSLARLVPIMFHYNGEPLSIDNYFPMEPMFDYESPRQITLLCSRQVGKTMQMMARGLLRCAWMPHWNILFVGPIFENIRRVSTDYCASLVDQSPCKSIFTNPDCVRQVLERSLPNHSRIRFTYACRSADRARGIHAKELILDEFQLMFPEVVPVLAATMAASKFGDYTLRAGTPLTNSNHLSVEFKNNSSRSHWMIPCRSCRKENVAEINHDLLGMIGPLHDKISMSRPAILCAKCRYPLFPWDGQWAHFNPEKRKDHLGLHIPGIILPLHCCDPVKWKTFTDLMNNSRVPNFTKFNEALGVPYDDGVTLLTQSDVERFAVLGENNLPSVIPLLSQYNGRIVIGVDWGGGGLSGESLTKVAVCALNHDGRVHVLFGMQFGSTETKQKQAEIIHYIWAATKAQFIAHDNLGIGSGCEAMLVEKGVPISSLVPMEYAGETQGQILRRRKASGDRPRPAISVDKTRGLLHMIEAYRSGQILTFKFSKRGRGDELLLDLTHLRAEEKVYAHSIKSETILIHKEPGSSDDFAHAVHFGANLLWMVHDAWPQLAKKLIIGRTTQDFDFYMSSIASGLDPETLEALFDQKELHDLQTAT